MFAFRHIREPPWTRICLLSLVYLWSATSKFSSMGYFAIKYVLVMLFSSIFPPMIIGSSWTDMGSIRILDADRSSNAEIALYYCQQVKAKNIVHKILIRIPASEVGRGREYFGPKRTMLGYNRHGGAGWGFWMTSAGRCCIFSQHTVHEKYCKRVSENIP